MFLKLIFSHFLLWSTSGLSGMNSGRVTHSTHISRRSYGAALYFGASREAAEGTENESLLTCSDGPPPQMGVLCQWAPLPEETNSKQKV